MSTPHQVEIWFSILHRRIIRYGDFGSTEHQKNEVEAFIHLGGHPISRVA